MKQSAPTPAAVVKPKVAFVCGHNFCRSQIAEALAVRRAADVFDSYSAGTEVVPALNPDAVRLMKQRYGIDMVADGQHSKLLCDIPPVDVVVFMGCQANCPLCDGQTAVVWNLDDPNGGPDEGYLNLMDVIEEKIELLKKQLGQAEAE